MSLHSKKQLEEPSKTAKEEIIESLNYCIEELDHFEADELKKKEIEKLINKLRKVLETVSAEWLTSPRPPVLMAHNFHSSPQQPFEGYGKIGFSLTELADSLFGFLDRWGSRSKGIKNKSST